eukprot:g4057.t1
MSRRNNNNNNGRRRRPGASSLGWMFGGGDDDDRDTTGASPSSSVEVVQAKTEPKTITEKMKDVKVDEKSSETAAVTSKPTSKTTHPVVTKGVRASSNVFACGSNQNAGNFITNRPTTRVRAPPGGRSQISFGCDTTTKTTTTKATAVKTAATKTSTVASAPSAAPVVVREKSKGTSANAFACGSNQNAGNFITDRPTTRVHAPPGGRSQITFGSTDPVVAKKRGVTAPPPAPVTTDRTAPTESATPVAAPSVSDKKGTTSANAFACGSNQNAGNFITDRPTTRVHAPPGGRSQITFGCDTAPTTKSKTPSPPKKVATKTPAAASASTTSAVAAPPTNATKGTSANAFACGSNQNAGNFITDRPTTRVHAPPGGRSSGFTFG